MASRNGLNPKIRGPKGVGFGRALPNAFGFGNGIKPNGSAQYITIPGLVGVSIPEQLTFELWVNPGDGFASNEGWLQFNDNYPTGSGEGNGAEIRSQVYGNVFFILGQTAGINFGQLNIGGIPLNQRNHLVFTFDFINQVSAGYLNGNIQGAVRGNCELLVTSYNGIFELFNLFALTSQGVYATALTDEFRIYKSAISESQITQDWNNGIGNNPAITEYSMVWYTFEKFELLDFSKNQDGSNMQIGIRDMSGNNRHGLPINMITDPTQIGYNLKPF
ncbi:LamG-like jellyroll fold domain-containing protein [Mucilaginibacter sp. L196]|uniref:LamG-like jellyroll fold domain-containing protein n=1 Tax=Mucilaginibacter sp. L196 TaxID=1641870 RepID=UPI00131E9EE9|nr:LamG-like jellyroll fold domain-containing protein [Mucilaginibacter sp. L196]